MKILAWICGILAVILFILADIMWLFGVNTILGVSNAMNYIQVSTLLVLFTIAFLLFDQKKE